MNKGESNYVADRYRPYDNGICQPDLRYQIPDADTLNAKLVTKALTRCAASSGLKELQRELAVAQTVRNAYAQAFKAALPKDA